MSTKRFLSATENCLADEPSTQRQLETSYWAEPGPAVNPPRRCMIEGERSPNLARVLLIAAAVTLAIAALSYGLPAEHAATGVSFAFLASVYWLVLRSDSPELIRRFGLGFGGVLEPQRLDLQRLFKDCWVALKYGGLAALVFFPPFWFGWLWWWRPHGAFSAQALAPDEWLGQFLVIALPEEAFYRGYLQTSLDQIWKPRWRVLGTLLGPGLIASSAIFAAGHLLTEPHPSRLAVFFPALVFGWLRARTGGIGASVVFHALCNLFASHLAQSYGLARP